MSEQQIASAALGDEEEIFGTVDAAEIEKQPMIEFGLVEDEKAEEFIQHEIEEIVEASVALEKYIEILDKARWDGVSKQTARTIMVGVKRIDDRFGQRSALSISMEDETDGPRRIGDEREQSKLSKEGLIGRAKELWEKFVAFMKKAFTQAKEKMMKVYKQVAGIKTKLAKLYTDFENWSPNGPNGGKKITLPSRVAAYTYYDGEYIDLNTVNELLKWIFNSVDTEIVQMANKIRGLKGTEDAASIIADLTVNLPPLPSTLPAYLDATLNDGVLEVEFKGVAEEVEVQVRSKSEIRGYLKLAMAISDMVHARCDKAVNAFDASLEMMDNANNLVRDGSASAEALQNIITKLNAVRSTTTALVVKLLTTVSKAYEVCDLERGREIKPDEDEEYGMEDFGTSIKNGLKKLIEAFKALVARLKDRWNKIINSPEVMEAKTSAAKEKVQANKGAPPKAENQEEKQTPETMHTVWVSGPMATAISENGKLISPERYIPLTKYVIGTVGKQLAPMVEKLINGYNSGDLDAMRSVADFDLPVFEDEVVNGYKVAYDADGSFMMEGEELNATEVTWPTFDELMAMFASMEVVSNTMRELGDEANRVKMIAKMDKFTIQLTEDLLKPEASEKIKVAMESRVKLMKALSSATEVVYWLNSRTFEFLTFSMKK